MNKNIFPELAGTVHEPNVGYDVMQDLVSVNDRLKVTNDALTYSLQLEKSFAF